MYDYNTENVLNSTFAPSAVHNVNNATATFFRKYLLQKAMSVFKWTLPDTWNRDYFLYTLYINGTIAIFNTAKYGVIPQFCTLNGYDIFYAPRYAMISNPLIGTKQLTVNEDCVLLKLQSDYTGILDLLAFYTSKLALCADAVDMDLINSKLAYVFAAKNKAAAESFKKMYDQISEGNPAVVIDKDLLDEDGNISVEFFQNNLKNNYIVSDLLSDMRKIDAMFCTDVGIPNANTDKKERLVTDEVNANNVETITRAEMWLEQLKAGCEQANSMFGLNINVDWRHDPNESNSFSDGDDKLLPYTIQRN